MKRIHIKVFPNSKTNSIETENNIFKIRVTSPAVNGKANQAAIKLLAEYFSTKKSNVKIIKGEKSREKIVEVG